MARSVSVYSTGIQLAKAPDSLFDMITMPVASATIIAKLDLVNHDDSGNVTIVDAAGDNDTYIGLAGEMSLNGDTAKLLCYCKAMFYGSLGSAATTYPGKALKYNGGPGTSGSHAGTTAWSFSQASSGADGICWAKETLSSGTGPFLIYTDSFIVSVGNTGGTGFWEAPAA